MTTANPIIPNKKLSQLPKIINQTSFWRGMALLLFTIIVLTQLLEVKLNPKLSFFQSLLNPKQAQSIALNPNPSTSAIDTIAIKQAVLPADGVVLPIIWGDLGKRMIADGVIDETKFRALFEGGLTNQEEQMLSGNIDQPITLTQENSRFILDMLWAFGLANKNDILENGEMTSEKYGGDPSKFASTGGWSLAKGAGPDHYSQYQYITLSAQQQALVDEVSKGIYRPCCGNSTHFPDCNHGMAMLGLLELMAKNGASEQQMYDIALKVNSFWFPQTYIDLATYFQEQGQTWDQVDAKLVLSAAYSSARGYQQTRQQIKSLPKPQQGGGGCGA